MSKAVEETARDGHVNQELFRHGIRGSGKGFDAAICDFKERWRG
jgi:hypothetical protein